MYLTHNEGMSVAAKRFIKALKDKIYKKLTANLGYLNKIIDEYNNTYHHSIVKKLADADYSALTEEIETNPKSPKFRVGDRVRITKHRNIFSKGYTQNRSKEIFVIDSVLKTSQWTYKITDVNGERMIGSFYEK